ncbi:MAG: cytochrome c [Anaerolineales bacterium]|uniref:c-type cytochrome n=1 Tax=Candidatus Villigracilis proximus TaxID=3140683 RepID=UPI003135620F|nr:cytochrome c [Anaerolineales bacterium]MBK8821296.1 cytochrome c [Anaerolineales bacterium]MBK9209431.1 cytochrome c [Anaerolineales bacterium]
MKKVLFAVLVLAALALAACGGGAAVATPAPVPAEYAGVTSPLGADAAAAGAEVFNTNCASCHGPQGHGDGPAGAALDPTPKNLPELMPLVGDDFLYWRINTGKEGTSMVAWKGVLTDEQIWQVIAYVRTLK